MASKLRRGVGLCGLLVWGCGGGEAAKGGARPEPQAPAQVAPAAVVAPVPGAAAIQETTFRLALEGAPEYAADKQGQFRVVLTALGGYHVNPDYPIRVDVEGPPALQLAKRSLGKPDAAEFGEHAARFDVGFSARQGLHEVKARVDFAVCTKETCVPDQRTVALKLNVM